MRTSVHWRAAGLAVLVAGLGFVAGVGSGAAADSPTAVYKPVLPEDEFAKLVNEDAKVIKESLEKAKGTDKKKMLTKAKAAALMIAVYAQDEMLKKGPNAAQMAGLRDEAVKTIKAISDDKLDQAKKLADDLKPSGAAAPGATMTPLALTKDVEIDVVMQQFKPELGGGLGLEKKMNSFINKRTPFTAADYQQMLPMLYRIAAIAQPTEALTPAPMGKKTPDKWVKLSQEMSQLALETANLAKKPKPDPKAVKAAVNKLSDNCTACHNVFRDE